MINLDIGCGREKKDGFVGIDSYLGADVVADMMCLPFASRSVDYIRSSHALEHIPKGKVVETLIEWDRVLKDGCGMEIRVPDLIWCCTKWLEHQTNDWWMDIIFGNQEHPGEFHLTGFTMPILERYLKEAGLIIRDRLYDWDHNQQTIVVFARRMT